MTRAPLGRLLTVGAACVAAFAVACKQDNIAGPAKQLGPPLLDITLSFPGTAVFPSGGVVINAGASRDSLTVTLNNLAPLPTGSAYQFLVVDSATTNVAPLSGRLITMTRSKRPVNRDSAVFSTTVDTVASAATLAAADTNQTFTFLFTNASSGATIANYTHVVGIVTTSPVGAGTLSATTRRGFLSARYRNGATNAFANGSFTFGSWAINTVRRLPFNQSGSLLNGAFWGRAMRINVNGLVRPPEGWRYATWLIDDRTGSAVRTGGLLTPVPGDRSLDNADVETTADETDQGIIGAQSRGYADSVAGGPIEFDNFTRVEILLEPKGAGVPAVPSGALVIGGPVPVSVSSRHPGSGKLSGTVTSAGSNAVANATIVLTGVGSIYPLVVTNADNTGAFLIRSINVGTYSISATAAGDSVAGAAKTITIGSKLASDGSLVGDSVSVAVQTR
jgi:hypothetical protein